MIGDDDRRLPFDVSNIMFLILRKDANAFGQNV